MTKPVTQLTKASDAATEPSREWLLRALREILDIALERVTNPKTPNADRIKWSRVVISAGQACNSVLRDVEIETLKQQVMELKALAAERMVEEENEDAINPQAD